MKNDPAVNPDDMRRLLSAIADGEAGAAEVASGCRAWAADARLHERWHAYHLIGDVLRSEDLAHAPRHDQAFLERLRLRLDAEPAVLAPTPLPQSVAPATSRRHGWRLPLAMAAGVTALAAVLVLAMAPTEDGAPSIARAPQAVVPVAASVAQGPQEVAAVSVPALEPVPAGGRMVRDAQLDRYLRAHRDYAAALPGSLPGGAGRSISTVALER
jgi:sigma-E factor negative regulatory protein RseA